MNSNQSLEETPSHLNRDLREELFHMGAFRADPHVSAEGVPFGSLPPMAGSRSSSGQATPAEIQSNLPCDDSFQIPSIKSNNSLVESLFEDGAFRRSRSNSAVPPGADSEPESPLSTPVLTPASSSADGDVLLLRDMFDAGLFRKGTETLLMKVRAEGQSLAAGRAPAPVAEKPAAAPSYKQLLRSVFDTGTYRDSSAAQAYKAKLIQENRRRLLQGGKIPALGRRGGRLAASAPASPRSSSPLSVRRASPRTRKFAISSAERTENITRSTLLDSIFSAGTFRSGGSTVPFSGDGETPLPPMAEGGASPSLSRGLFDGGAFRQQNETLMQKYTIEHGGQTLGKGPSAPDEVPTYSSLLDAAFVRGALSRSAKPSTHGSSNPDLSQWGNESAAGQWNVAPLDLPRSTSGRNVAASAPVSPGRYGYYGFDSDFDLVAESSTGAAKLLESMFRDGQFRLPSKANSFIGSDDSDGQFRMPSKTNSFIGEEDPGRPRLCSIDENEIAPELSSSERSAYAVSLLSAADMPQEENEEASESLASLAFSSGLYRQRADSSGPARTLGRL